MSCDAGKCSHGSIAAPCGFGVGSGPTHVGWGLLVLPRHACRFHVEVPMQLVRVQHVKLPVTDLRRSVTWYASLLDMKLIREFVESGALRGVALRNPSGDIHIALREREACASRPVLTGFDPFALRVASRQDLQAVVDRCQELGIEHGGIQDRGGEEAVCDVADPDGTVLRFLWTSGADENIFVGLSFDESGAPSYYDKPRYVPCDSHGVPLPDRSC